ncbi:MAG: type 2 isopentenyl-diphosphate Delta-isomerase [Methanocalculus sp. MSAO_Arc1]|uniref:type 2 isopentenyl-diphosphate Delta-isomerase n=1 Tax=Methanocalculus TaxID=71151 RepID=UPI000FF22F7D|nr:MULTISPECIES: type 2 isopentenyl-diphosphate Delta-isomerase [unclassified Methanocalculus]MCP1662252.1 isopentenyl-diphosphate delta-isomerase [Methanocalculus sp. AMF5]RQD81706.1 MAG: type 2 isopentenyl-diphosphate Delta-isomerase [Methanocalculus sp. MSAO_Arc1]
MTRPDQTRSRKLDHLRICSSELIEAGSSGFADVRIVHNALPECAMDEIDLSCRLLGHTLSSPLFIAAMTGGHPETTEVNRRLGRAAEVFGCAIGVGSQRAALEHDELAASFAVVREEAPTAFIAANIGAVQLRDHGVAWADKAVSMIDADAVAIHLNFLQEAIQPEGDRDARGCLGAIEELCSEVSYPVIIKETGSGISRETARLLWNAGVQAIDVGGHGGTSWARVEGIRGRESGRDLFHRLGEDFVDWGIPTVVSLLEARETGGPVIATGGVRDGIDIAKALALGADMAGMALPLLAPAIESDSALLTAIGDIHSQLKAAMFLSGAATIRDMRNVRTYVTGETRDMIQKYEIEEKKWR